MLRITNTSDCQAASWMTVETNLWTNKIKLNNNNNALVAVVVVVVVVVARSFVHTHDTHDNDYKRFFSFLREWDGVIFKTTMSHSRTWKLITHMIIFSSTHVYGFIVLGICIYLVALNHIFTVLLFKIKIAIMFWLVFWWMIKHSFAWVELFFVFCLLLLKILVIVVANLIIIKCMA